MYWALIIVLLLVACGMPLFAAIVAIAMAGFFAAGYDLSIVLNIVAGEFYRLGDMPGLIAIPLFTLAGYVLGASQAPSRLVRLSDAVLGWLPGGLAIVAIVACAFFTAFTGASGVTIVALGSLLYPALRQAGYNDRYALGLVTAAGSLGLLFAPSLPLILYGFVAGQMATTPAVTMDALFLAGLLPGALMIVMLSGQAIWQGRALPATGPGFSFSSVFHAVREAIWELPLPFLVLGGVYGGWLAVSEAAAVTAAYVLIVEVVIKREIKLSRLPSLLAESMRLVGAILLILGTALALSNWMIDQDVPGRLFEWAQTFIESPLEFLLVLNVFLLLVGMLLDIFSAIVILTPLLMPLAMSFGVHPVHFGIVMLANLQLGYFTPPVGMNLFIAAYRFEKPFLSLVRASLPFLLILGAAVLLITWQPWLSLWFID